MVSSQSNMGNQRQGGASGAPWVRASITRIRFSHSRVTPSKCQRPIRLDPAHALLRRAVTRSGASAVDCSSNSYSDLHRVSYWSVYLTAVRPLNRPRNWLGSRTFTRFDLPWPLISIQHARLYCSPRIQPVICLDSGALQL